MVRLSAIAILVALIGCYGDMVSTQPGPGDGDRFEGTPIDPNTPMSCADPVATSDDGHHFEGMACLGCHTGSTAPEFTLGGTLYADPDGTTALDGLNISLVDDSGAQIDLISALNGNFYSTDPIVFPVTAFVSACPDVVPMPILLAVGDCNSCHIPGDRITFSP